MKKTLLAVIIAATALVPPAALAQDRGRWGGRDRSGGGQSSEVRQNRSEWRQQQTEQAPQAQPQQRQWNGGGERQRGGWSRPQQQAPQQQAPQQQAPQAVPQQSFQQQQQQRWGGNRGDRSQWNNNGDRTRWSGSRSQWSGGDRRPDAGQQQLDQQRQQQYRNTDRSRWSDRNRSDRGNRDWNDGNRTRDWSGDRNRYDSNRTRNWSGDRNRYDSNRGRWNNNWRNDRRYDWRGYRTSNRSLYRLPRYYAPSGWGYGYRRFGIGSMLDSILYSSSYWINDPFYYRLPEVDGPYRWVRYYNDALLIDIYSGEVVDTIYDIFW
jgi:TolA-binding protein